MFCPKHLHELALKCIGCYLKQTCDRGMVMNPSSNACKIDAYPDDDFAGMYGHEDHTDSACAKSRTGFIITFSECPVFWQSKLQTTAGKLMSLRVQQAIKFRERIKYWQETTVLRS